MVCRCGAGRDRSGGRSVRTTGLTCGVAGRYDCGGARGAVGRVGASWGGAGRRGAGRGRSGGELVNKTGLAGGVVGGGIA